MENEDKSVTIGAYIYPKDGNRQNRIHVLYSVTERQSHLIDDMVKQKKKSGEEYSLSSIINWAKLEEEKK